MTKVETVNVMKILSAVYGQGKADAETMAKVWHTMLKDYPYVVVERALYRFIENDTRDYATFPSPGKLIAFVKEELTVLVGVRNKALRKLPYIELTSQQRSWCNETTYEWMCRQSEDTLINGFEDIKNAIWARTKPMIEGGK